MNPEAAAFASAMNALHADGRADRSVDDVLNSAPRGWPRPVVDGLPSPWIAQQGDLGDVEPFRRACAVMMRLCQVCGEPLGATATVFWVLGDVIVIDGAAVHPERCAPMAERLCPALRAKADAGTLRKATVLTATLRAVECGARTADEGMPRGYQVPTCP